MGHHVSLPVPRVVVGPGAQLEGVLVALVEVPGRLPLVGLVRLVVAAVDLVQVWPDQAGNKGLGQEGRLNFSVSLEDWRRFYYCFPPPYFGGTFEL